MPQPLPGTVHDPATGGVIPASWGDAVNDFLADIDATVGARVTHSTTQTIPNATWTVVAFDGEDYDTADLHDVSTQNTRLTIPAESGGAYLVFFRGRLVESGDPSGARFRVNGSTVYGRHMVGGAAYEYVMAAALIPLAAGDYVEAMVYADTGGYSVLSEPKFALHRLGPST
jgi:hypothetical protein